MKNLIFALIAMIFLMGIGSAKASPDIVASIQGGISVPIAGPLNQHYSIIVGQSQGYQAAASIQYSDGDLNIINANWYRVSTLTPTELKFDGRIIYYSRLTPGIWAFYNHFYFSCIDEGAGKYHVKFTIMGALGMTLLNDDGYLDSSSVVKL